MKMKWRSTLVGRRKVTNKSYIEEASDDQLIDAFVKSNSWNEFYINLGYRSRNCVSSKGVNITKSRLSVLGLDFVSKFKQPTIPKNQCLNCGKETHNQYYCSTTCQREYYDRNLIEEWQKTGETHCGVQTTIRSAIRKYIYKKQDYKCAICQMLNMWNGKEIKFVLDHIDGDATNNCESNLRLICPNCDSQLPTFKSKNKNSKRNKRKKYTEVYKITKNGKELIK